MARKITNQLYYRALFLSYQRVDLLEKSLRSFFETSTSYSRVLVLDNGSNASDIAKLRDLAAEFPDLKLIEMGRNIGGEAFNGELEKLDEEWVLLAENDMLFQPGWENAFARAIQAFPDLGQISPLAVVPGDDEVWDPHHFVARVNDGVVIHDRVRGNVGTTCLLRGDLIRAGLRVHNLSNDGSMRLPDDVRLSREVRERGFRVANLGRSWVHNLGHSEQEFSQRRDYYRENYAAKPIGEDGWLARCERFASRTACPDRTMRIGKLQEKGMPCWMPYLDLMNMESRQWTMLDGGNPEVEGLEWLAAKIRLEKPQLVIITPIWDGMVERVCNSAIERNGFGQVIAVDSELDLNQLAQNHGIDPFRTLLVCCSEALEIPISTVSLKVPVNWGSVVVFGRGVSYHLNFEGSSNWRCVNHGLPRGLAEWQNLGSTENSNTGEGEKRTAFVEPVKVGFEPLWVRLGPNPADQIRMTLPLRETDFIQKRIFETGMPYEVEVLDALASEFERDDLMVDVGANIGNHSLTLARRCGMQVVAFEPGEEAGRQLRENIALNDLGDRIEHRAKALGAVAGRGELEVVSSGNLGGNRVRQAEAGRSLEGGFFVGRLDDEVLPTTVRLLKIDVEGMEREVLEGATALLNDHRPLVCIEIFADAFGPMETWLSWHGYELQRAFLEHHTFWFRHRESPEFDPNANASLRGLINGYGTYGLLRKRVDLSIQADRKTKPEQTKKTAEKKVAVPSLPGSQLGSIKAIFSINTGRSGSDYLAKLAATAPNVVAKHEPRPIGHAEALHSYQHGDPSLMNEVVEDRLARIKQANLEGKIYVETNHCFIKGFGWLLAKRLPPESLAVIELTRDPKKIAASLFRNHTSPLQDLGRKWLLCPDQPGMEVSPPGLLGSATLARKVYEPLRTRMDEGKGIAEFLKKKIERYEMRALRWYVDETALRGRKFRKEFPNVKLIHVSLNQLNKIDFVRKLWKELGIAEGADLIKLVGEATNRKK